MSTCSNCGRPVGIDSSIGECGWLFGSSCLEAARKRPTYDALQRELTDAKAEVERLREQLRDTLEERATMARDVERLSASDVALGKVERILEDAIGSGPWGSTVTMARRVRLDVDELRRLAWEWCIEARYHYLMAKDADMAADVANAENELLRTALVAKESDLTRDEHDAGAELLRALGEPPIESLGPVPVTLNAVETWEHGNGCVLSLESRLVRIERALAYTIRDAVRRGAKLASEPTE